MVKAEPIEWFEGEERIGVLIEIVSTDSDGAEFSYRCMELWRLDEDHKICEVSPYYHDLITLRERLGLD